MSLQSRRRFLGISAAAFSPAPTALKAGATPGGYFREGVVKQAMQLGLIIGIGKDPESAIAKVHGLGLPTCQAQVDSLEDELAARLRSTLDRYEIEATSLVVGGPGPEVYDFYHGPVTIGLVPRAYRKTRIEHIKRASDFARNCRIPAVQTHCGFIPEDPNNPLYQETVAAIREVASYCKRNGQMFRYETGQETPITLLRAIQDVDLDNQGVNFDMANPILYDKANPVDALEVLGPYVQGTHAKDGLYPTDPRNLGREVPIGQGKVDFPRIIQRLKELNYRGAITIEREISGPQQIEDVRAAKVYLEKLVG